MKSKYPALVTRRQALKKLAAGAALAGLGLAGGSATAGQSRPAGGPAPLGWELPELPYAPDALEPHFDVRTMEIHHGKHHQAYITNAKKLLESHPALLARGPEALVRDLATVPESIRTGIRNNAGGHVNHAFFWRGLAPAGTTSIGVQLAAGIARDLGSLDDFKKQFADAALKRFGSGWAWLSVRGGQLVVHSTANQDSPLSEGLVPVLGLDVWEHAYYLRYENRRGDFVGAFWNIVNWSQAEANYTSALGA